MSVPLADGLRPQSLDEVVGQQHLLSKGKVLRRLIDTKQLSNMIFYGPSGVGKTTVARIIAENAGKKLHKLNGTTASTADIKAVFEDINTFAGVNGVILYLDEIQYLNKKQQQTLLEFIENGTVTLIASTTENPYFYIYNAILSRSTVFEFKPVDKAEIEKAVKRAFVAMEKEYTREIKREDGVDAHIAASCGGDVRKSINAVEMLSLTVLGQDNEEAFISLDEAKQVSQRSSMRYDRDGDEHYDILSALQKSIRGSDPDAGLHYLARLLSAGDLISSCRRLLVIASEDIGLAYPQAVSIVKSCVDSALQLGLPEARLPLAQAVLVLATAPKSNSVIVSIENAMADIKDGNVGEIPKNLKDGHYGGAEKLGNAIGYKYSHNYENNYIKQQYLPDILKDKKYYDYGNNKNEQASKAYWDRIKSL